MILVDLMGRGTGSACLYLIRILMFILDQYKSLYKVSSVKKKTIDPSIKIVNVQFVIFNCYCYRDCVDQLVSLDLSWCPRVTDAALEYIACDLTHLEELTLDR